MERREYNIRMMINGRKIKKAIIDPHYEIKHSSYLNDQIILRLIKKLDNQFFEVVDIDLPYSYFVTDGIIIDGKKYKLVWLLEDNEFYIGIINAYRRR